MLMKEIKAIAKQRGIAPGRMNKTDLVRTIQTMEGNSPCFQTAKEPCNQTNCLWYGDCMQMAGKSTAGKKQQMRHMEMFQATLAEMKDKIAELQQKTKQLAGKAKAETHEEIMHLEEKYQKLKEYVFEIGHMSEEPWQDLQDQVTHLSNDMYKSIKKAFAKFH